MLHERIQVCVFHWLFQLTSGYRASCLRELNPAGVQLLVIRERDQSAFAIFADEIQMRLSRTLRMIVFEMSGQIQGSHPGGECA